MVHTGADSNSSSAKHVVEHPDDIVISGMSIRCSQSENVEEFAENLYNGVNMVHENLQRCDEDHFGVPKQHGFIKDIRKFDATFFNVHPKQAEGMDPQLRILHEVSYECIIDAGVDPKELKNSNTGVFIGTSNSDAREAWTSVDVSEIDGYSLIGTHRAFLANRISFTFDLRGPSFGVDAACATTGVAINQGYLHVKNGVSDAALVGGVSLVYNPKVSYQILKLGLLCKDGKCKVFDEAADGYVRAEAIVCLLLQKRKNARRIYATLLHSKINNDGFKEQGITFPCTESQGQLVAEVYAEAGVDPEDVEYVEAHGTGTTIGDPQETNGIALGFAGTRTKPLPIGAVKSNMGHSEHASGGVSVVKILIAMQTGVMPGNLHYKTPNPLIPALVDGRLKVVTENMKWNSTLAGVNCFGFGGQNSHLILRGNPNICQETLTTPRLFVYMGRTAEAAQNALNYVNRYSSNPHVQYLLLQSAYAKPASMPFRGYTLLNTGTPLSVVDRVAVEQKPVWWIFSGQGTQWASMGKEMMALESFAKVIRECAEALVPYGLDLVRIVSEATDEDYSDPTISFVGVAAIQVALVDLLRLMEISPQGLVGHSAGEIGCAYADGCFTAKEAMLAAYWRGRAVREANLMPGAMAAVGLSWEKAKELCTKYKDVTPACNNADDNVTVSGSAAEISRLVADMKPLNIFAKEVNSYGVAFHSPAMQTAAPIYLEALKKALPNPKMRTSRWVSTAVDEDQWSSHLAKYASAEYFANNLTSTVKFDNGLRKVPSNAIVLEIAPHGLLQALIRKTVGDKSSQVALMKRGVSNNLHYFFESIGKLYVMGLNPTVANIFPKPSQPAPRDTPFIGSVVQWDHSASWRIPHFTDFIHKGSKSAQHTSICDMSDPLNQHMFENVIDGHARFSTGGFIALVAKAYGVDTGKTVEKSPRLIFSDLCFLKPVTAEKHKNLQFSISIAKQNGYFEIMENSEVVVTGFVSDLTNQATVGLVPSKTDTRECRLKADFIYEELAFRGYDFGLPCKILKTVATDGLGATIQGNSYESAVDGLVQLAAYSDEQRRLIVPRKIRSIKIDMPAAASMVRNLAGSSAEIISAMNLVLTTGVEIEGIEWEEVNQEQATSHVSRMSFVPFEYDPSVGSKNGLNMTSQQLLASVVELAVENSPSTVRIVELVKGNGSTTTASILNDCQLPSSTKLQFNSFLLKADQNTEIEQGSATVLILQDYFSALSNFGKELQAVTSLIQDDGFLIAHQRAGTVFPSTAVSKMRQTFATTTGLTLVSELMEKDGTFLMCRKVQDVESAPLSPRTVLTLSGTATDADNMELIRSAAKEANAIGDSSTRVWIVAPRHIAGLSDTILDFKEEYPDAGLRLIDGNQIGQLPPFDAASPFYAGIVSRDFVLNVNKNGVWGSCRSVPVENQNPKKPATSATMSLVDGVTPAVCAAYSLMHIAKATSGQIILINITKGGPDADDMIKVAVKLGLKVHVISPSGTTSLPVGKGCLYEGNMADLGIAQKIWAATGDHGVDVVYNLSETSVLRDSLRLVSPNATYIEGNAGELDTSCFSSVMTKGLHTFIASQLFKDDVIRDEQTLNILNELSIPVNQPSPPSTNGLSSLLFPSEKDYFIMAGDEANAGVKLAFWLAKHGVRRIHIHATSDDTTQELQSQLRHFKHFPAQVSLHVTDHAFTNSIKPSGNGGLFVLDSLNVTTTGRKQISKNMPELLERMSGLSELDHFVVVTSGVTSNISPFVQLVERRNTVGLSGLVLDIPALMPSDSSSGAHHDPQAITITRLFASLEVILRQTNQGTFVARPERKVAASDRQLLEDEETGPQDKSYLPQAVAKIMGIKDFASLDMFLSLGDYGIDSLMAMELGRILERDFNLSLTLQEIRSLCIRDICLLSGATNAVEAAKLSDVRTEFEKPVLLDTAAKHYNLTELVPKSPLVLLRQVPETTEVFFIVHPMEGAVSPVLETVANHLQITTYGLNCTQECDTSTMKTLASFYLKEVKKVQPTGPYNLGGYSFGAGVAFEMALQLERENEQAVKNLILLDGSHSFVANFTKSMKSGYTVNPNMPPEEMEARKLSAFETAIVTLFVTQLVKTKRKQLTDMLSAVGTFEERVKVAVEELQRCDGLRGVGKESLQNAITAFAQRLKMADAYKPETKYSGRTTLIKCSEKMMRNLGEFYELDKVCLNKNRITTATVPGNHEGFVLGESARITAKHINDTLLN